VNSHKKLLQEYFRFQDDPKVLSGNGYQNNEAGGVAY
jgi:hypothetical protein